MGDISERVKAVEALTRLFHAERIVHLAVMCVALALLFANAIVLIINKQAGPAELTLLFGSSGLITYSAGRLLFMWSQALKIIAGTTPPEAE